MTSYGYIALALVIGLVALASCWTVSKKRDEVNQQHMENVEEILEKKKAPPVEMEEADLYIALFTIYARDHVTSTGRKLSSNRLSKLEAAYREGYQVLMGRGLPEMDKPYQRIKAALKSHDLMVEQVG
ncbi:hypothetical protein [Vibrio phage vB_pir03]|nr:hypothetical protein [Vibrio phage vB_pir03]